jgi:hypothetical protein
MKLLRLRSYRITDIHSILPPDCEVRIRCCRFFAGIGILLETLFRGGVVDFKWLYKMPQCQILEHRNSLGCSRSSPAGFWYAVSAWRATRPVRFCHPSSIPRLLKENFVGILCKIMQHHTLLTIICASEELFDEWVSSRKLSIAWGWCNRPVVAAVSVGLSFIPLRIIKMRKK